MLPEAKSPSPAITAAARILHLLWTESPNELGVNEISRRLGLPKASVLRHLQAMRESSLVLRHPKRLTYVLGPILIQLGAKAAGEEWVLGILREAVTALSSTTRMNAEAYRFVANNTMVCVASCAGPGPISIIRHVGATIDASPSISLMQRAWAKADSMDLDGGMPTGSYAFEDDISHIRRNCFSWALGSGGNSEQNLMDVAIWLEEAAREGLGRHSPSGRAEHLDQIRIYTNKQINNTSRPIRSLSPTIAIAAPVFDWNGILAFRLLVVSLLDQVQPSDVMEYGRLVRAEAARITNALGGYFPLTAC